MHNTRAEEYSMDEQVGGTGAPVKSNVHEFDDDDLLVAVFLGKKAGRSPDGCGLQNTKRAKKLNCSKGISGPRPSNQTTDAMHSHETNWASNGHRTVLSWLLHSSVVYPKEVIQFRNPKDDYVMKEGMATKDGIVCFCCNQTFSRSEFESHSDLRSERSSMNLVMKSGKPLALCQLEAWSAEYQAKKAPPEANLVDQGDDVCGLCGRDGELVCCENCPATFHPECLFEQLPEGKWYCSKCRCLTCWDVIKDKHTSISPGTLKCSMCGDRYHEACMKGEVVNIGLTSDKWFCGQCCYKLYDGLKSYVGLMNHLFDEFSWRLLRCMDGDYKAHTSRHFIELKAECNSHLAVAITLMGSCFLQMVDSKTGIDMIPQVIYNRRSMFPRLNYEGFYTVVLEKKDVMVSVASIRCHGVQVAELPFIATCGKFRGQGMCQLLVSTIEKLLKSLGVKKLAVPAADPQLVDMWMNKYGFLHLDEDDKSILWTTNLMVLPGSTWLVKAL